MSGVMLAQNVVSRDNAKISGKCGGLSKRFVFESRDIYQDEQLLNAADEAS